MFAQFYNIKCTNGTEKYYCVQMNTWQRIQLHMLNL